MIQYYNMDFSECTVFLKNFLFFFFLSKSAAQGADQVYFWYSSAL